MWTVKFSDRTAKCTQCNATVGAFDPRVDWDDEEGEGDAKVDWRHRRYCLPCGIKLMEIAERNTVQRLAQARLVHNQTAKRFGRKPIKAKLPAKPKTIPCTDPSCKLPALLIVSIRSTKVFACEAGHVFLKHKQVGDANGR
jgi:hypothetical protein